MTLWYRGKNLCQYICAHNQSGHQLANRFTENFFQKIQERYCLHGYESGTTYTIWGKGNVENVSQKMNLTKPSHQVLLESVFSIATELYISFIYRGISSCDPDHRLSLTTTTQLHRCYLAKTETITIQLASLAAELFGKFGESSVIHQTRTIHHFKTSLPKSSSIHFCHTLLPPNFPATYMHSILHICTYRVMKILANQTSNWIFCQATIQLFILSGYHPVMVDNMHQST